MSVWRWIFNVVWSSPLMVWDAFLYMFRRCCRCCRKKRYIEDPNAPGGQRPLHPDSDSAPDEQPCQAELVGVSIPRWQEDWQQGVAQWALHRGGARAGHLD